MHILAITLCRAVRQFPFSLLGFGLLELGNESIVIGFINVITFLLTMFLLSFSTNHNFAFVLLFDRLRFYGEGSFVLNMSTGSEI